MVDDARMWNAALLMQSCHVLSSKVKEQKHVKGHDDFCSLSVLAGVLLESSFLSSHRWQFCNDQKAWVAAE